MSHIFYHTLNYPVPQPETQFLWIEEDTDFAPVSPTDRSWSSSPSKTMSDYIQYIYDYARLYRSIPFVEHIYLCNSITFNALNEDSDIDILIITKPGYLRLARAWSWLMFSVIGLKRFGSNSTKKFCLSFYIDREHCNLYKTALQPYDIYLCYWIAHLIPLYSSNTSYINTIYESNRRITHFLPNIHLKQNISISDELIVGESDFKLIMEKLIGGRSWMSRLHTNIIKAIWLPILHYKTRKLGDKGRGIIISDTMLKFYHDRRKLINFQYKQANTPFEKKENFDDESLF